MSAGPAQRGCLKTTLATLERGYAIVQDSQGRVIEDASQVSVGDIIDTRLARGQLRSQVTETFVNESLAPEDVTR